MTFEEEKEIERENARLADMFKYPDFSPEELEKLARSREMTDNSYEATKFDSLEIKMLMLFEQFKHMSQHNLNIIATDFGIKFDVNKAGTQIDLHITFKTNDDK